MKHFYRSTALVALLAVSACSGQTGLVDPAARVVSETEGVRISVEGDRILLANDSAEPVRFAAVEREFFEHALALWSFGFGEGGTLVAVGQSGSVRLSDVSGYTSAAREVMVFWWFERPNASDEEKAKGVRRIVVGL